MTPAKDEEKSKKSSSLPPIRTPAPSYSEKTTKEDSALASSNNGIHASIINGTSGPAAVQREQEKSQSINGEKSKKKERKKTSKHGNGQKKSQDEEP
ncbi:hypothetical protein PoB_004319600 [Plakobranchus ocellatus]|uniref:Uncharacterized protein n=1 Tax=Plakobranchus ocellatus TaxID=259542 RepID=A0AAV4AZV8_9GAST|nr:hypothetical protein PoB_004319600 [Plakobranchus ocellatus]